MCRRGDGVCCLGRFYFRRQFAAMCNSTVHLPVSPYFRRGKEQHPLALELLSRSGHDLSKEKWQCES